MAQTMTFPAFMKYRRQTIPLPKKIDMFTTSGDPGIKVGLGDVLSNLWSDELDVRINDLAITLPSEFELMGDNDLAPVLFGLILYGADEAPLTFADAKSVLGTSPILVSANGGLKDGMYNTGSLGWVTCMGGDFTAIANIGIPTTTNNEKADEEFAIQVFVPDITKSEQVTKPSPAPMLASRELLQRLYDAFIAG